MEPGKNSTPDYPFPETDNITDYFSIEDLQRLQDLFSDAVGVAAILRYPDGAPITHPSNYCGLFRDFQPLHDIFWESSTPLIFGSKHIATWVIGQVRKPGITEETIKSYAGSAGIDPEDFYKAFEEIQMMTSDQFDRIARMLHEFAGEYTLRVYQHKLMEGQVKARQLAEEQISMHALALKSISEGICISDLDDNIIYVNEAFLRTYGYKYEELLGQPVSLVRSAKNNPRLVAGIMPDTLKGGWKGELINQRKDGTEFPAYISTSAICNDQGETIALMGVATDITENKMYEEALRESELKYRSLFDGAHDAIFIMNNHCFLDCNQGTEIIFGVTADQIIGASPADFSPQYQPDGQLSTIKAQYYIDKALAGESQLFDWVHIHLDGTPFYAEVALNRIMLNGSWYLQAIVRDMTKRKLAEDAILEKANELERFNKLMIGRELKMVELKQEINGLLRAQNQPEKYRVHE